ncbi:hypothetical protein ACN4EB_08855 [Corynebacterium macclintockiae]|uniref:hypothetical protein n=1 Tax=Corynebacterium macclintockiae TaxID=2913501 RepID=UPI003EB75C7B
MESKASEDYDVTQTVRQLIRITLFCLGLLFLMVAGLFYDITLISLASLVTLGSIAAGTFLILRSYTTGDAKFQAISSEVEQMSNDASFDISEELITWEKLKYTKGIGTGIEGQDSDIEDIHRRLVVVREELAQATTPVHRIEAVLAADSVLAIARELRKPAQS